MIEYSSEYCEELHVGGKSWQEIADDIGDGSTADSIRSRVKRLRRKNREVSHPEPQFGNIVAEEPSLQELFKLAKASQSILDKIDPIITHETITINSDKPIGIIFVSCAHLGSRYTFYEKFEEIFNQVLNADRLYFISLGDDPEGFTGGFPDASAVTDQAIANPKVQRKMLAYILDELSERGKLLAGCASQHGGDWNQRKVGDNPIKDIYLQRGVPFFDGKALVTLKVGKETYQIALAHEFPGNSSMNSNHSQKRAALYDFPSADVVAQGDKHKYSIQEHSLPPHEFDAGLRPSYIQYLIQTGTAKTGNDKYSIRGWSRGVLEWPILIFDNATHDINYTRNLKIAKMLLDKEW